MKLLNKYVTHDIFWETRSLVKKCWWDEDDVISSWWRKNRQQTDCLKNLLPLIVDAEMFFLERSHNQANVKWFLSSRLWKNFFFFLNGRPSLKFLYASKTQCLTKPNCLQLTTKTSKNLTL